MRVAVMGGGFGGLVASHLLAKKGYEVFLFEKDGHLGGIAAAFHFEDTFLDRFYRHVYVCDKELLSLISELGLDDKLRWHPSRMGLFYGGKTYGFGGPLDLMKFTPLSIPDRVRFGLITLYLGYMRESGMLDEVTADEWLGKRMGKKGYEVVWAPLLKSKFAESYQEVPLAWFWSKIQLRKSNRTKTMSNEKLGYLEGSFKVLLDSLEEAVTSFGGIMHKGSPVQEVLVEDGKAVGIKADGRKHSFDRVLSTMPLPELAGVLPKGQEEYREKIRGIDHKAILVMALKLNRSLSKYYWLNISDSRIPFNLLLEHTNLVNPGAYNGKHVLYISNYLSADDPLYSMTADELFESYLPHLKRVYDGFDAKWVEDVYVFRNDYGTPVFDRDYKNRIPSHKTPIKNLFIACGEQIYPQDRGMSKTIEVVKNACGLIEGG